MIGQVIHDADLLDEKYGRKDVGIDEVLNGWAKKGIPDAELLERGIELVEGLYHSFAAKTESQEKAMKRSRRNDFQQKREFTNQEEHHGLPSAN